MTDILKLRYKRITKLMVLALLLSCVRADKDACSSEMLEHILDAYIESCSITKGQCIVIAHTVGWTDSTAIVSIFSHQVGRFDHSGLMFSEYQGFPVYYDYGILKDIKSYVSDLSRFDEALPNKLKWSKVSSAERPIDPDEESGNPEKFKQIYLIYQPSFKCIREVLLDRNGFEQKVRAASDKCPNFCSR
jgi:hypothetical protein